jgi:serine/threonine-protein kinase
MSGYESEDSLPPGHVIEGRWKIERILGRGGMAVVYEAQHLSLDRRAALKVLDLHGNSSDLARMRERFEREAKLSAKITHPNVVTIYDHGFVEGIGQPYIAMEFLEGHDLEVELQKNGSMSPQRALRLFDGALDALARAHREGIVHKDLKPSNLFIVEPGTRSERLVLLDFGIAGVRDDPDGRLTRTHEYAGTPAYAAPEYIEHRLVTPALDVYQMALILGETLSGSPVVQASTPMSYMMAHCQGRSEVHPRVAASPLGPVLAAGLAVNHLERYPSAAEMRDALAMVDPASVPNLAGITGAATFDGPPPVNPSGPMIPPPLEQRRDQTVTADGPFPKAPKKKSNLPLILVALALFGMIGVVGTGALVVAVFAQGDAGHEDGPITESSATESASASPLSSLRPTMPTPPKGIPGMNPLKAAHLGASMTVSPIDNTVGLFLGFWGQFDGKAEDVAGAAPSSLSSLFESAEMQLATAAEADGKLGKASLEMMLATSLLEDTVDELHEYYTISEGYKDDGHAGGLALKEDLAREYADYTKARDAFVVELVAATDRHHEGKRASATPARAALYDVIDAAGAQTVALLRDPGGQQARDAMANFKRVYSESRKLIKTDDSLRGALEEAQEILEANKELLEELDAIDKNAKWDDETKRYKRISARGWSTTHYFWLTRGLEFD